MPDITMCVNTQCSKRGSCYRYLAAPKSVWQSFILVDEEGCENFWQVEQGRFVRSLKEADAQNSSQKSRHQD
jgi:hypothetical protein